MAVTFYGDLRNLTQHIHSTSNGAQFQFVYSSRHSGPKNLEKWLRHYLPTSIPNSYIPYLCVFPPWCDTEPDQSIGYWEFLADDRCCEQVDAYWKLLTTTLLKTDNKFPANRPNYLHFYIAKVVVDIGFPNSSKCWAENPYIFRFRVYVINPRREQDRIKSAAFIRSIGYGQELNFHVVSSQYSTKKFTSFIKPLPEPPRVHEIFSKDECIHYSTWDVPMQCSQCDRYEPGHWDLCCYNSPSQNQQQQTTASSDSTAPVTTSESTPTTTSTTSTSATNHDSNELATVIEFTVPCIETIAGMLSTFRGLSNMLRQRKPPAVCVRFERTTKEILFFWLQTHKPTRLPYPISVKVPVYLSVLPPKPAEVKNGTTIGLWKFTFTNQCCKAVDAFWFRTVYHMWHNQEHLCKEDMIDLRLNYIIEVRMERGDKDNYNFVFFVTEPEKKQVMLETVQLIRHLGFGGLVEFHSRLYNDCYQPKPITEDAEALCVLDNDSKHVVKCNKKEIFHEVWSKAKICGICHRLRSDKIKWCSCSEQ